MNAKHVERAAYLAAHRILMANTSAPELACPGARRSYVVDTIANIIRGVFELEVEIPDQRAERLENVVELGLDSGDTRRTGALFELPRRASS